MPAKFRLITNFKDGSRETVFFDRNEPANVFLTDDGMQFNVNPAEVKFFKVEPWTEELELAELARIERQQARLDRLAEQYAPVHVQQALSGDPAANVYPFKGPTPADPVETVDIKAPGYADSAHRVWKAARKWHDFDGKSYFLGGVLTSACLSIARQMGWL